MKLLLVVPYDEVISHGYFITLKDFLYSHPDIIYLDYGIQHLWDNNLFYDVYHFHWPECIFYWKEPSFEQINALGRRICEIKRRAKIITTIHNEFPHYRKTNLFQELYDLVITNSDLIVHMGKYSKQIFDVKYPFIPSIIIPHHNYRNFKRLFSKSLSRQKLGIPEDKIIFVSVGRIRHPEEANLLLHSFLKFSHPKKFLFVLHGDASLSRHRFSRYFRRIQIAFSGNIKWINHFVSDDMLQLYLCAADILIVPRFRPLNSGNVILGFNFGKVVVGPDYGNVGEILKETGNPTFDPHSMDSVLHSFYDAVKLLSLNKGEFNFAYAMQNWSIEQVGNAYVDCYRSLVNS
ncbi:MAG: glycosyltransferase family 4 protein [Acidobacterium ailaaui]|nr:glycosyltransferase family 4 protein [Pseudacidobacterium ailaaui]